MSEASRRQLGTVARSEAELDAEFVGRLESDGGAITPTERDAIVEELVLVSPEVAHWVARRYVGRSEHGPDLEQVAGMWSRLRTLHVQAQRVLYPRFMEDRAQQAIAADRGATEYHVSRRSRYLAELREALVEKAA
jgi:hypothetical protein